MPWQARSARQPPVGALGLELVCGRVSTTLVVSQIRIACWPAVNRACKALRNEEATSALGFQGAQLRPVFKVCCQAFVRHCLDALVRVRLQHLLPSPVARCLHVHMSWPGG